MAPCRLCLFLSLISPIFSGISSGSRSNYSKTAFLMVYIFVVLTKTSSSSVSFLYLLSKSVYWEFLPRVSKSDFSLLISLSFALLLCIFSCSDLFFTSVSTFGGSCLNPCSPIWELPVWVCACSPSPHLAPSLVAESIHKGSCRNGVESEDLQKKRIIKQMGREKTSPEAMWPQREEMGTALCLMVSQF